MRKSTNAKRSDDAEALHQSADTAVPAERKHRRLPAWLVCLIGCVVSLLLYAGILFLFEMVPGMDFNHPQGFFENLMFWACLGFLFVSIGFFVSLIVRIVNAIYKKVSAGYRLPRSIANGDKDDRVRNYQYQKDDELWLKNATEPLKWRRVVVLLIVLFPLGVFFLIRKLVHEKTHYVDNGIKSILTGSLVLLIFVPWAVLLLVSENGQPPWMLLSVDLILSLFGAVLLIMGVCIKHIGLVNNAYMVAIMLDRITNVDALAERMHTNYAGAVKAVQRLIDLELLEGAYIYHKDRVVIVPGISEKIAIKCQMCGGTTVLYSSDPRECVYCGAKI